MHRSASLVAQRGARRVRIGLVGAVQGYNRFCRIDMLSREEYIGADRSVSFRYYVRAPTYMQRSHDQVRVSVCAARPHRYCATVPTLTDAQQPTVEC